MAAYIINLTLYAFAHNEVDGFAMVFHVQPVAYIAAVTVYRKALTFEDILYNQRNQFFGEVIRAIVIGTAGNGNRHFIGIMIGHHHHIGTGLRRTVRAMRTQRRILREETFRSQRTVNFVRRHLVIAHSVTPGRITGFVLSRYPRTTSGIQQILSTQNISHKEKLRVLDTAVYMAFCCKVHHIIEFIFRKQFVGKNAVADIAFNEKTTFIINIFGNSTQISGVSQGVQYHNSYIIVLRQNILYIISSDKSGSAGYKISLHKLKIEN